MFMMFWVIKFGNPTQRLVNMMRAEMNGGYFEIMSVDIFIGGNINFLNDYIFCVLFSLSILTANAFFKGFLEMKILYKK